MVIVLLFLTLATSLNLSAEAGTQTYQIQPNVPVPPPTGYIMVPESRLQEMFAPQGPQVDLKKLADEAFASKNAAQRARLDVTTDLNNYKKAAQSVADAEAVSKAAQQLINDRKKAKDAQEARLKDTIKNAEKASQTAKAHVKAIHDNAKAAKNPDTARAASITEEVAGDVDKTIKEALAEVAKDSPVTLQVQK